MDLSTFTSTLTPAYASDLMATGQGTVRSVVTFGNVRLFSVDGLGVYLETATPVASGNVVTGWINYDISDDKVALYVDLLHEPLHGTIMAALAVDNAAVVNLGTSSEQGFSKPTSLQANQSRGSQFQLTFTLTPTSNVSPKLTRWTLRSYPAPNRSSQFMVPIILAPTVAVRNGERACDIVAERIFLESQLTSQQVISYQQGNDTYQVVMFDFEFLPEKMTEKGDMQGIFLAYLNEITS